MTKSWRRGVWSLSLGKDKMMALITILLLFPRPIVMCGCRFATGSCRRKRQRRSHGGRVHAAKSYRPRQIVLDTLHGVESMCLMFYGLDAW